MDVKKDKFINSTSRRIVESYTLPNNYRVKLYTYHDKVKKVYWTTISECMVEESGTSGIYFERYRMNIDLNRLAGKVDALRYDSYKMQQAHELALYGVRELIDQLLESHKEEALAI